MKKKLRKQGFMILFLLLALVATLTRSALLNIATFGYFSLVLVPLELKNNKIMQDKKIIERRHIQSKKYMLP